MEKDPLVEPHGSGQTNPTNYQSHVTVHQPYPGVPSGFPGSAPSAYHQDGYQAIPGGTTVIAVHPDTFSLTGHFVISCLVFWFCGWIIGGIAFILAVMAQDLRNNGNIAGARSMAKASMITSVIGMVIGIVACILVVVICCDIQ